MIKPIERGSDYLEFKCSECDEIFHNAIEISHDAPTYTDEQKYDIRNWTIMKIHLQCPKCKDEGSFKLAIYKF